MTNEQPEALRLADALENLEATGWGGDCFMLTDWSEKQATLAAAELRRLHAENQALRATLEDLQDTWASAVQGDLENGVKWLNERAYAEFASKYRGITEFGSKLIAIDQARGKQ